MTTAVNDIAVDTTAVERIIETVRRAASTKTPLAIRGANTKGWYGNRIDGEALDVRAHAGIVDYEPSELVLVARAGTQLDEIDALLASHRQMLAFEPPRSTTAASAFAGGSDAVSRAMVGSMVGKQRGATLGGCIATGLSGPRRMAAGAVRDFVLGARLIDGRGQHLSFGGRVMKNVAGYDVSRALAGSLGTLGIITEVALKVLPIPAATATLSIASDEAGALERMNQWAGQPVAITASAWLSAPGARSGSLMIRLEGSEAAVQAGIRRIGGVDLDPAEAATFWRDLREQTHAYFARRAPDAPQWRLALPLTAPPLDAQALGFDDQLIEWGGGQRWIATHVDPAIVRATATRLGGHATLWRASDEVKSRVGAFTPLAAPLMAIHRRLKNEFDPDRVFNRGRLYPEL